MPVWFLIGVAEGIDPEADRKALDQMIRSTEPKPYPTSDITLAAFLTAHKVELVGSQREGGRIVFFFQGGPRTEELVAGYFDNREVAIGDFRRAWHDLKNLIFSNNME